MGNLGLRNLARVVANEFGPGIPVNPDSRGGSGMRVTCFGGITLILLFCVLALVGACSVPQQLTEATAQDSTPGDPVKNHDLSPKPAVDSLQESNNKSLATIQTAPSKQLQDNRIGNIFGLKAHLPPSDSDSPSRNADAAIRFGYKWVTMSAALIGEDSQFEVEPSQEQAIARLVDNGISIMFTILCWDEALPAQEGYAMYEREKEICVYLEHARRVVRHFKGRVRYYQILSEPINTHIPKQHVEPPAYINLIRRVVPVIRNEDPEAKIVVGGATNLMQARCQQYLHGVVTSDVMPLVDGIFLHPMYGPSPQYEETRRYYYDYPSLIEELRRSASAHGFRGDLFSQEMAWRTQHNPNPYEPWQYTDVQAGKYYARAIVMHLGMNIYAGIGGEAFGAIRPAVAVVRNLCTVMAGNRPTQLPIEIVGDVNPLRSYAFSLPDDEHLLALWRDNAAVDKDRGVQANVILKGFAGRKATGIDVLRGVEQELMVESKAGNLVIPGVFVKDYPILLRFTGSGPMAAREEGSESKSERSATKEESEGSGMKLAR